MRKQYNGNTNPTSGTPETANGIPIHQTSLLGSGTPDTRGAQGAVFWGNEKRNTIIIKRVTLYTPLPVLNKQTNQN